MATNAPRPVSARHTAPKRPAAPGSARPAASKPTEESAKRSSTARLTAQPNPAAQTKPAASTKPVAPAKPVAKAPAKIDVEDHDGTSTADLARMAADADAPATTDVDRDAVAAATGDHEDATPTSAPASSRPGKARTASTGRQSKATATATGATGRYAAKKSGGIAKWVVLSLVVVLAIAGMSYSPVRRNMALSALDACKDPAKAGEAIAAADAFLAVVDNSGSYATLAIINNRGPVEAQIHMAKTLKLFPALVRISERPLTDAPGAQTPPRPDLPVISQDQRIAALNAATEVFSDTANATDLLPDDLGKWAKDGMLKHELAVAAMRLIAKTKPKFANDVFSSVANEAGQDPLRVNAALDGIGELSDVTNLGFAIGLLSSRVADQAITRTALTDKITRFSNADHLPRLIELLNSPKDAIRAIAIESMGGVNMRLGDSPDHVRRREELGKLITPKLDAATSPVELTAALKAVKALRLTGARDAVLALIPKIKSLALDGISEDFIAETLGKSLISPIPDAPSASAEGAKKTDALFAIQTVRTNGEELIGKLILGLDNDATRTVCAKALSLVTDTKYLGLRASLDKLAEHGTDDVCFTTLLFLVGKTYGRDDVSKSCGKSLDKWKAFLASDRPRFDRVKEVMDWMAKNQQFQYVKDGKPRLTESKEYLSKAQEEFDAWIQDKAFVAPLGLTKNQIESLDKDVKMLGLNVRKAWSGAIE